jgi:protein-tyrosine phosphatase
MVIYNDLPMFDLHNHILPTLDDGPNTMKESILIAQSSWMQGIEIIVATPHRKDVTELSSVQKVKSNIEQLNDILLKTKTNLKIVLGMENHIDELLPEEIISGKALPINEGKCILLEMPYVSELDIFVEDVLMDIKDMGLIPLIAHPERMNIFQTDPKLVERFKVNGILMQVTSGSIYGRFGNNAKLFTKYMLENNLVDVVASDTHMGLGVRDQDLRYAYRYTSVMFDSQLAKTLFSINPKIIIGI